MKQLGEEDKKYKLTFEKMVNFVRSIGLEVNTNTKARGHQGFFLKNRIDISSNIDYKRKIEVLIHEFTHYVHYKIDPSVVKSHGSLAILFPDSDIDRVEAELMRVTKFVDRNRALHTLYVQRENTLDEIKKLSSEIKMEYPDFKRSSPYKPIEKEIKKTDAKYLLKYDRVKVKIMFLGATKDYSVQTIDTDFPKFDYCTKTYIVLKSKQRLLKRISGRINRLSSYYKRPTELFARFVEALFVDTAKVSELAPHAYLVFCSELSKNRYLHLADLINNFF